MPMAVHIGKLIKAEMERQERGPSWLAKHLHCNRQNVYDIFTRESCDTALLAKISVELKHDFFKDLSGDTFGKG